VAGTPVLTPSGELPIEQVHEGDMVLSRSDATGEVSSQLVARVFVRMSDELIDVEIASPDGSSETVRTTPEHPFWTPTRGWSSAGTLTIGDRVVDPRGGELSVTRLVRIGASAIVYNFEVAETHTYFVGHMGAWVHNQCTVAGKIAAAFKPGDLIYGITPERLGPIKKVEDKSKESGATKPGTTPVTIIDQINNGALNHDTPFSDSLGNFGFKTDAEIDADPNFSAEDKKRMKDFRDFIKNHPKFNIVDIENKMASSPEHKAKMDDIAALDAEKDKRTAERDAAEREVEDIKRRNNKADADAANGNVFTRTWDSNYGKPQRDKELADAEARRDAADQARRDARDKADSEREKYDEYLKEYYYYELLTKTSKGGIENQIDNTDGFIHFVIDSGDPNSPKVDTAAAAKKEPIFTGNFDWNNGGAKKMNDVITHHELRWIFREGAPGLGDRKEVRDRVIFWGPNGPMKWDDVFGGKEWADYEKSVKDKRGSAAGPP
jgi:hypothetical protein